MSEEKRVVIVVPFGNTKTFVASRSRGVRDEYNCGISQSHGYYLTTNISTAERWKRGTEATRWIGGVDFHGLSWTLASITIRTEPTVTLGEVL